MAHNRDDRWARPIPAAMEAESQVVVRPPAGWYPDPAGSDDERYWDGDSWTTQRRDSEAAAESSSQSVDYPIHSEPPHWYPDPDGSGGERFWDGEGWTKRRRRKPELTPLANPSMLPPTPRADEATASATKIAPDLLNCPDGHQNSGRHKYCAECGAPLAATQVTSLAATPGHPN